MSERTTSTMALTTTRPPDPLVKGLPMAALPTAPHLRIGSTIGPTMVVWLLFVITMFVVGAGRALLGPVGAMVLGLLPMALLGAQFYVTRRFVTAHNAEVAKLLAGDVVGAASGFDALARRFRHPQRRALTMFNLGVAEARLGHLEHALSIFAAVHASKTLKAQPLIAASLPAHVAMLYGRLGDVDGARAWLETIKQGHPLGEPLRVYAEALLLVREGNDVEAEAAFVRSWLKLEHGLQAAQLYEARIIRALAASRRGESTTTLLAPLRPVSPGTYQHLAAGWPELQAFLVDDVLL